MKRFITTSVLTFALSTLLPAAATLACPMCKDSIPNSDAEQSAGLPVGFNYSVYYMFAGLFLTIGLISGVITKGIRSADERMNEEAERRRNHETD